MGTAGFPMGAPKAPLPRRAREIPPKAGVWRVYIYILVYSILQSQYIIEGISLLNIHNWILFSAHILHRQNWIFLPYNSSTGRTGWRRIHPSIVHFCVFHGLGWRWIEELQSGTSVWIQYPVVHCNFISSTLRGVESLNVGKYFFFRVQILMASIGDGIKDTFDRRW